MLLTDFLYLKQIQPLRQTWTKGVSFPNSYFRPILFLFVSNFFYWKGAKWGPNSEILHVRKSVNNSYFSWNFDICDGFFLSLKWLWQGLHVDFLYQLWFNFELHLIAIKLVKEESLVDMLHSYHAVPFVALYFYLKSKDFLL
jgi:hypothetical protein